MRPSLLALLGVAVAASGPALAQPTDDGWQELSFQNFSTPSPGDPLQALVWPDVIREQNAYVATALKRPLNGRNALLTALSATFPDGDRSLIISVALSRQCESGANDKGARIEASTCPVRIATVRDGRLVAMRTVTGCYADHADPNLPAAHRRDGTDVRFDRAARTIALRTRVGGAWVPACAHTYPVE